MYQGPRLLPGQPRRRLPHRSGQKLVMTWTRLMVVEVETQSNVRRQDLLSMAGGCGIDGEVCLKHRLVFILLILILSFLL